MSLQANRRRATVAFILAITTIAFIALVGTDHPGPVAAQEADAVGRSIRVDWSNAPEDEAEARRAGRLGDGWVAEIEELLFGNRLAPRPLIDVRFNGGARIGDPPRYRVPHVDAAGAVQLYRYGDTSLDALPHELVHAVLRREGIVYGRFDEEGLANWVAYRLRPSIPGFPAYGHPLELIVGHQEATGRRIPLTTLRARQRELNLRCSFQAYPLRASFFLYLGERFGATAMIGFLDRMGAADAYETTFGASLADLERDWLVATLAAFERLPDREAALDRYLGHPAISSAYMCAPGRDY